MKRRDLLFLAVAMLPSGCHVAPLSEVFHPAGTIAPRPQADTLVVVKPTEGRPEGSRSSIGIGLLVWLPGVPYAHQKFTPEGYYFNRFRSWFGVIGGRGLWFVPVRYGGERRARPDQYLKEISDFREKLADFRVDLGQTIAEDLRAAGIATTVLYGGEPSKAGALAAGKTFVLDVRLKECFWHRYLTFYGLSLPAILLFALPNSYGHIHLEFEATLKDADGKIIGGQQTFVGKTGVTEWFFGSHIYPRRLPLAYGEISPQLRRFVSENLPK